MSKGLITIFLFSISVHTTALIKVKWFGITSTYITDGKTSLLFDPVVTRPSLFKLISFQNIQSDPTLVKSWSDRLNINNVMGIFISHSHADHSLDAGEFTKLFNANLYGGETTLNIARGYDVEPSNLKLINLGSKVQVGDFLVTTYESVHSPLIMGMQFSPGILEKPLSIPSSYYSYKMGKNFFYHIQHPQGSILFHPSASLSPKVIDYTKLKSDLLLIGIASRESTDYLNKKIIQPVNPKMVIPIHFDDFFSPIPLNGTFKNSKVVDLNEFTKNYRGSAKLKSPLLLEEIVLKSE